MIFSSQSIFAATNETTTEDGEVIVYESFTCTDEEIKEFIERENTDNNSVSSFKDFKQAFKDVKKAQEEQTGSGPGGCLTIFDTYEFPKLPDEFFSFDPTDLTNIPALIAQAAMQALKDGYCKATSTEFFEKQKEDALQYYAKKYKLKEKGIKKLHEPWLPQVMNKELEYHLTDVGVKYPKDAADFLLNEDDDDRKDAMDDYFDDLIDEQLDEHFIEN